MGGAHYSRVFAPSAIESCAACDLPTLRSPWPWGPTSLTWRAPPLNQIVAHALPYLGLGDRVVLRVLALLACRHIVSIHGLEHIRPACDPFILAANHSTRRESVMVPSLLFLHRSGRLVHFLADWNFRLIPGVGFMYARAQVVTVTRKSAKPRVLNVLKPLYEHAQPTWSAPARTWPPAARSEFFRKARSIAIPRGCCGDAAAPRGCRSRPACRWCRWAFAFPTPSLVGRLAVMTPWSFISAHRWFRPGRRKSQRRCQP